MASAASARWRSSNASKRARVARASARSSRASATVIIPDDVAVAVDVATGKADPPRGVAAGRGGLPATSNDAVPVPVPVPVSTAGPGLVGVVAAPVHTPAAPPLLSTPREGTGFPTEEPLPGSPNKSARRRCRRRAGSVGSLAMACSRTPIDDDAAVDVAVAVAPPAELVVECGGEPRLPTPLPSPAEGETRSSGGGRALPSVP